ncbi:unnamed protein product [Debaryomyces tyrocola]|nr:unnamed protein product [Debaryomyces tyrocola]
MTDFVYQGSDFEEKVKKQVEFYFSDSNLQTDKFLWRIYEANDGWVELKTILTFGRMRQYRPEEKVIAALKTSDKLVLSPKEDMVRRKDPLKEFNELKNTRKRNSVHIEGFPNETTQEDLEEFFNTKIIPNLPKEKVICSIRRIKTRSTKEFFGVVDIEFKTQEDADYFLKEIEVSYPQGIVAKDSADVGEKSVLRKMSLLTFQEMRESSKRFGVNEVTKRRNSFNDSRGNKKFGKGFKGKKNNRRPSKGQEDSNDEESANISRVVEEPSNDSENAESVPSKSTNDEEKKSEAPEDKKNEAEN